MMLKCRNIFWLHLEQFRTTLFRQTMFAEFEYLAHTQAENGESLSKDWLCSTYAKLNADYYGPAVNTGELISYECTNSSFLPRILCISVCYGLQCGGSNRRAYTSRGRKRYKGLYFLPLKRRKQLSHRAA